MAAKVKWDRDAWWVFTHHNRKRTKKRIGPTKADKRHAEEIARKINAALALGTFPTNNGKKHPIPCDAELRHWLGTYSATMKPSSEISARGLVEKHLVPHFGATDLRELQESHLLQFAQAKLDEGLSPKTIQNALAVLRRVLNLAMREGRVSRNPASRIGELMRRVDRRVAREVTEVETWSRSEIDTLLELAREHEPSFYPALLFLLSTGVRRGELLGLKWADLDFDKRSVSIRRAITVRRVTTPKSGRSRVVQMTEALASELFDLLAQRRQETLARGPRVGVLLDDWNELGRAQLQPGLVPAAAAGPEGRRSALEAPHGPPYLGDVGVGSRKVGALGCRPARSRRSRAHATGLRSRDARGRAGPLVRGVRRPRTALYGPCHRGRWRGSA